MSKEKADKNIHEALNYLRLDFRNLGELLGLYHPLEVLKLAAWEERRIVRTRSRDPLASASGRLLPVLLQSIIQSTYFKVENGISSNRNIREKDWHRILGLVDDVSKRLLQQRCPPHRIREPPLLGTGDASVRIRIAKQYNFLHKIKYFCIFYDG